MKFYLDCYPCILKIALGISKMAGLNDDQSREVMNALFDLLQTQHKELTPPILVGRIYDIIRERFYPDRTTIDPYLGVKKITNRMALQERPRMRALMDQSADRLETAVRIAGTGNIIDFGTQTLDSLNISQELDNAATHPIEITDLESMRRALESAALILYVTDNAGEIVFDSILIEEITSQYPQARVICAVHGRPVLNDALEEDAKIAGIDTLCTVISSGSGYAGTVLHETTPEFQRAFNQADVIISKGQGNFESLGESDNTNMFFLLRVKCECVAKEIGAEMGSLVLKRKKGTCQST